LFQIRNNKAKRLPRQLITIYMSVMEGDGYKILITGRATTVRNPLSAYWSFITNIYTPERQVTSTKYQTKQCHQQR